MKITQEIKKKAQTFWIAPIEIAVANKKKKKLRVQGWRRGEWFEIALASLFCLPNLSGLFAQTFQGKRAVPCGAAVSGWACERVDYCRLRWILQSPGCVSWRQMTCRPYSEEKVHSSIHWLSCRLRDIFMRCKLHASRPRDAMFLRPGARKPERG